MIDFDRDTALMQKLLAALDARAKTVMHNIANQNTVGFKRYEVRFEDLLKERLAEGGSPAEVEPVVVRDESGEPGQNNVTLVEETALLDKTKLMHEFATRRMGSYFGTLNKAVYGR